MRNNIFFKITIFTLLLAPMGASAQVNNKVLAKPTVIKADPRVYERAKVIKPGDIKRVEPTRTPNPGGGTAPPAPNLEEIERLGPANKPFVVSNLVQSDVDFTGDKVLNVYNTIFRDANMKSGYYYYLPASYSLNWSPTTGKYDFEVTYGKEGRVTVTAILRPKMSKADLDMARDILAQNIKGKPEQSFGVKEFIPVPMSDAPELEFTNLSLFGVPAGNVSLRPPSDLTDPIYISFTTDRIDELMAMFFNNVGLYGDVLVHPEGAGMPATIRIPFNLKIDSPDTYGKFELQPATWRNNRWRNESDYPVILTNFHVLKRESTGVYRVYTWKAGDIEVPNGAMVNFDAALVPAWIDNNASVKRIWLDYSIKSCNRCNKEVKSDIIGGLQPDQASRPEKLEFTILTPISFTKASLMKISIRSHLASPEGETEMELPSLTVTEDGQVLDGGTLYVRNNKIDFKYKIKLYLEDGTPYESDWIVSKNREVVIGSSQIRQHIPHFKD